MKNAAKLSHHVKNARPPLADQAFAVLLDLFDFWLHLSLIISSPILAERQMLTGGVRIDGSCCLFV
jgi:hypothetical protein